MLNSRANSRLGAIREKKVIEKEARIFTSVALELKDGEHPALTEGMHSKFVTFYNNLVKELYVSGFLSDPGSTNDGQPTIEAGNNQTPA